MPDSEGSYQRDLCEKNKPMMEDSQLIRPLIHAIKNEATYQSSQAEESQGKEEKHLACKDPCHEYGHDRIDWTEFKSKMMANKSVFEGKLKGWGRKPNSYVVRVSQGYRDTAVEKVKEHITPCITNIEVVEVGDTKLKFLGGDNPSRVVTKHCQSGVKIMNVHKQTHERIKAECAFDPSGTLTLLLKDKMNSGKYYGLTAGHVLIEGFTKDVLTIQMEKCPWECHDSTVLCHVEYQDGRCESQRMLEKLAEELSAGVECFEDKFMDCGIFEISPDIDKSFLKFELADMTSQPAVFEGEQIVCDNICRLDIDSADGRVVEDDVSWFLGEGDNMAVLSGMFTVKGKEDQQFASPGHSGKLVHDKNGNLYGIVVACDDNEGVTFCIRLDTALKYIEKMGQVQLGIIPNPQQSNASSSRQGKTYRYVTDPPPKKKTSERSAYMLEQRDRGVDQLNELLEAKDQAKTPEERQKLDKEIQDLEFYIRANKSLPDKTQTPKKDA